VSTTEVVPIRLSPAERRQPVEVGVRARKSNRAIGTELGVDEGTVRRDRKYLATPEDERPVRVPRPQKERPIRELSLDESRRRHQQSLLKAAQLWITQEGLLLPDLDLFVLPYSRQAPTPPQTLTK